MTDETRQRAPATGTATESEGDPTGRAEPPYHQGVGETLADTLAYARERDYRGPDYVDGMSSRLLRALPVEHKYLNLAVQESVKRAPIDLRPYFLVEHRRNFKGVALFAMANLAAADLLAARRSATVRDPTVAQRVARASSDRLGLNLVEDAFLNWTGNGESPDAGGATRRDGERERGDDGRGETVDYREEAGALCEWLIENRSTGYSGFCGGHNHVIQGLHHQGPINDPDLVSTAYAVKALLRASVLDDSYAETAQTAAEWAIEDMDYREVDGGAMITYYPKHPDDAYTLNAGAVAARMFVDLYDYFGEENYRRYAGRLLAFIADHQTAQGGWYYRVPADSSHLSMDGHHNGFIVEAFQRYRAVTGDTGFDGTLARALDFYRSTLFDRDGAPNFDELSTYPRDVHAAAQGILVFTYADDLPFARRILDWTTEHLSDGDGRFFFRKERFYTKRITLMRWCQAWMAYAAAEFLAVATGRRAPAAEPAQVTEA